MESHKKKTHPPGWVFLLTSLLLLSCGQATGHVVAPPPVYESQAFVHFATDEPDVLPAPSVSPEPTASPTPRPAKPRPSATPTPRPQTSRIISRPRPSPSHGLLKGTATWYCKAGRSRCPTRYPDRAGVLDLYAAAGPSLRKALGKGWRGDRVLVCSKLRCVEVKLVDWCACGGDHVIDLFWDAFHYLNPRATGGIRVAIDLR